MLVVDRHTLQAVNLLHFADEMFLQFLRSADFKNFVRVHGAFGQLLAFLHHVALEDNDVLADGDEVFLLHLGLRVFDDNATFAAHACPKVHQTVNLGNFRRVLRTAGFEQLRHAGQTAGNVLGLGSLARRLGHQCAGDNLAAFGHDDVRAGGNRIIRHHFAGVVADDDLRAQVFLVLHQHHGLLTGGLVRFLLHRHAFDDVVEFHLAGFFGENRHVIRIPLHEGVALLHLGAVLGRNDRADDHDVVFQFTSVVAENGNGTVFVEHDVVAILQFDQPEVVVMDHPVVLGLDLRDLEHLRRRAADVERPHRQLRARLADGLGGDDADRFAELDECTGGKVASITINANTVLAFAREHRADAHAVNARSLNAPGLFLVNFLVRANEKFLRVRRVDDVVAGEPAHKPVGQFNDFVFTLINRRNPDAVRRTAIRLLDDDILRHIHEFAGHVTGVRGFEGGVGETFARAMGRDEVFQY